MTQESKRGHSPLSWTTKVSIQNTKVLSSTCFSKRFSSAVKVPVNFSKDITAACIASLDASSTTWDCKTFNWCLDSSRFACSVLCISWLALSEDLRRTSKSDLCSFSSWIWSSRRPNSEIFELLLKCHTSLDTRFSTERQIQRESLSQSEAKLSLLSCHFHSGVDEVVA